MHVYTHTHTHSKNVSAALGSLQAVGVDTNCIIVSHWNGICLYQSVTQRDTADMTSDAAIKSAIVAFTFGLCHWSGGGGEQKCGHLWQLARELTPSPSLTLCTQQYFSLALFENLHSFFFIHSHTICLLCSLSSCLLAHVHYCALPLSYMCGFVCNSASKATQLPDNLTSIG